MFKRCAEPPEMARLRLTFAFPHYICPHDNTQEQISLLFVQVMKFTFQRNRTLTHSESVASWTAKPFRRAFHSVTHAQYLTGRIGMDGVFHQDRKWPPFPQRTVLGFEQETFSGSDRRSRIRIRSRPRTKSGPRYTKKAQH